MLLMSTWTRCCTSCHAFKDTIAGVTLYRVKKETAAWLFLWPTRAVWMNVVHSCCYRSCHRRRLQSVYVARRTLGDEYTMRSAVASWLHIVPIKMGQATLCFCNDIQTPILYVCVPWCPELSPRPLFFPNRFCWNRIAAATATTRQQMPTCFSRYE